MADQDKPMNNEVLRVYSITSENVEVVPEREWYPAPNGITDEEIEQIAGTPGTYGSAILERLRDAASAFNLGLVLTEIETPWRQLLDEFRDDLELTTTLRPLTLPDGSQQMVVVDAGKFPGHPKLRECLWNLHETLEEIENYDPEKHFSEGTYRVGQRLNGTKEKRDNEAIKAVLRAEYMTAERGTKGSIKGKIRDMFFVSERHLDTLIQEIKKESAG